MLKFIQIKLDINHGLSLINQVTEIYLKQKGYAPAPEFIENLEYYKNK